MFCEPIIFQLTLGIQYLPWKIFLLTFHHGCTCKFQEGYAENVNAKL